MHCALGRTNRAQHPCSGHEACCSSGVRQPAATPRVALYAQPWCVLLCRRVAAIPEGVREVLGLPSVPGGPLPGVPRPASARRGQRSLFEEALSETGSAGSVRTPHPRVYTPSIQTANCVENYNPVRGGAVRDRLRGLGAHPALNSGCKP